MSITSTKCYFKKPQTGRRVKCLRKILNWTRQALSKITFLFQKHLNHSRLHEGQEVKLRLEDVEGEPVGKVVRLDNDGFLLIRLSDSGKLVTAHPDGNSFDMMQGLIVPKVGANLK